MVRLVVCLLLLAACGGAPAATPAQVAAVLVAQGATNVHDQAFEASVPVPRSFTARQVFEIPPLPDNAGGQFFICDTKANCDAIFAYYDALKALAGPYLYRSASGRVVVQLNKGLAPADAAKYEAAVQALP